MLDALVVEAYESVARTPDLLPVLKENGVVDSGAFGFAVFMEAFVNAATGKSGELTDFKTTVDAKADVSAKVQIELNDDWEGSEFRYCNEFLFKAEKPFDVDESLAYLATLGDCELIVGAYPDFKVHVHSNEPNRVLAVHAPVWPGVRGLHRQHGHGVPRPHRRRSPLTRRRPPRQRVRARSSALLP